MTPSHACLHSSSSSGCSRTRYEGAIDAVNNGMLDESLIDDAVARLLTLKFQLGLFENPRLPDRERILATIGRSTP